MIRHLTCLVLATALLAPGESVAAPCSDLPNPVYLQVGDTQLNLMKSLGRKLRDNTANPMTLVFVTGGSCSNIEAIYTDVKINGTMQYVPSTAEDAAWTLSSPTLTCDAPSGGQLSDIANSAVFVSACTQAPAPANIAAFQGPVQAYVMAVPRASSQTAITAAEAYFVFGFGLAGMLTPWLEETQLFIRTVTKSTLLAWAANIAVPGDKWKGIRYDKSTEVVAALQNSAMPEKAIGTLGVEVYDKLRSTLKSLAFAAFKQYAAYYPDSTSTAFDKINVRDGHYTVWSPTIWLTRASAGVPTNARAKYVIDQILGNDTTPAANFDSIEVVAGVGLVPNCAMKVTRTFEGGNLSLYSAPEPCGCKFDQAATGTTTCTACTGVGQGTCSAGQVCRHSFCEAR